jgi:colanic acid/amylovoran biosynthesis glycosyltransferase
VRLAYLCNLYPAVSHSFVRREIEAVERTGHEVHRLSIRPGRSDIRDEADLREARSTEVVLDQGAFKIVFAAVALLFSSPIRTLQALSAAYRLSGPGLQQKVRHVAYWLEAAWLVRRLERLRIQHVHAHFGTNPAAIAAIVRAWGGPPYSFTIHGPDEFDAPVALSLGRKIANASFVAAISSFGRSQLMRWSGPEHWDKIHIIRCGLDTSFLEAGIQPVPAESTEFVCVARLSAQKGLPLLIAACAKLRDAGERFSVTIVGDGELRSSIEQEIGRHGLQQIVHLAGIRTGAEVRQHLIGARAFVLPSFAEGLPVVLMEALALSRPVITTAIAGIPELVDADCGWLIPAGSQEALAGAMASALHASPLELDAKGAAGRERVRRMHDAQENARLLVEAITREHGLSTCIR